MLKSDEIKDLATALAKAQGEMGHAIKDAVNPHFKSRYADLASVWDAIREPLSKHGLSVVQTIRIEGLDHYLDSILLHASGQFIGGSMKVLVSKVGAQELGSALTYARRYALSALVGVAPDDDDGNAASTPAKSQVTQAPVAQIEKSPITNDSVQTGLDFDIKNETHKALLQKVADRRVPPEDRAALVVYLTESKAPAVERALDLAVGRFLEKAKVKA